MNDTNTSITDNNSSTSDNNTYKCIKESMKDNFYGKAYYHTELSEEQKRAIKMNKSIYELFMVLMKAEITVRRFLRRTNEHQKDQIGLESNQQGGD